MPTGFMAWAEMSDKTHLDAVTAGNMTVQVPERPVHLESILLSRKCAKVRTVLFLPRMPQTGGFVTDRRDFPDCLWNHSRDSAAVTGMARHG